MVLGVINIIMMSSMIPTMIPGIVGLTEDDKHNRREDQDVKREETIPQQTEDRKQPANLLVATKFQEGSTKERLVLKDAKVYVHPDGKLYITQRPSPEMVLFKGGFYPHPSFGQGNTSGFVCIGAEQPPTLRWVFCDAATSEMRYGNRMESEDQICGPYDLTDDEQGYVTLAGNQWLAVQLPDSDDNVAWQLYCKRMDNEAKLAANAKAVEIHLQRVSET